MRHVARYLPAFLALLIPLAILAFLGSRELRRQQELAEDYLRDRALRFLSEAVDEFGSALDAYCAACDPLIDRVMATGDPVAVMVEAEADESDALLRALLVLNARGGVISPRPASSMRLFPPSGASGLRPGLDRTSLASLRDLSIASTLLVLGDREGAMEQATAVLATAEDPRTHLRAALQLSGLHRGAGDPRSAQQVLVKARKALHDLRRERDDTAGGRRRGRMSRTEPAVLELLCNAATAELAVEVDGDRGELMTLVTEIAAGAYPEVPAGLLMAVLDRASRCASAPAELRAEERRARAVVAHLIECGEIVDACRRVDRSIRDHLSELAAANDAPPQRRAFQLVETPLAHGLLALRSVTPGEGLGEARAAALVIDIGAFLNRTLSRFLSTTSDTGFHLDVRTPDASRRVLLHALPEGAADVWRDYPPQVGPAGLQFFAVPLNARAQIEARRATARNEALLVLVLCLVAGGGAFFLVRSVAREAELANMKVDLVSRVSHELRTPLAMIKMYGETLALGRTRDREQASRFAGIVSREADRLTILIDRILDFSQAQAGRIAYRPEPADLAELTETVADAYRPHVEATGAELQVTTSGPVPVEVDHGAYESALVNLLENAIKYTPPDAADRRLEVELSVEGNRAVVEVRDRGIGIPAEDRRRIFDSFYRAGNAGEIRGAGLGLSLVRHFANAHGGSIEALPRPGGGTVFRLELPIAGSRRRGTAPNPDA